MHLAQFGLEAADMLAERGQQFLQLLGLRHGKLGARLAQRGIRRFLELPRDLLPNFLQSGNLAPGRLELSVGIRLQRGMTALQGAMFLLKKVMPDPTAPSFRKPMSQRPAPFGAPPRSACSIRSGHGCASRPLRRTVSATPRGRWSRKNARRPLLKLHALALRLQGRLLQASANSLQITRGPTRPRPRIYQRQQRRCQRSEEEKKSDGRRLRRPVEKDEHETVPEPKAPARKVAGRVLCVKFMGRCRLEHHRRLNNRLLRGLPVAGVFHAGPGFLRFHRLARLQQLDRDVVG